MKITARSVLQLFLLMDPSKIYPSKSNTIKLNFKGEGSTSLGQFRISYSLVSNQRRETDHGSLHTRIFLLFKCEHLLLV